jgi:protein-tyrosine kinase
MNGSFSTLSAQADDDREHGLMDTKTRLLQRSKEEAASIAADFVSPNPAAPENFGALALAVDISTAPVPLEVNRPSAAFLRSQRVIAFDNSHWVTRYYDILRNLLRDACTGHPYTIAVTSPTAGCGATVSAVNLGLSFARMPGANVLLVDANIRFPAMARLFGLPSLAGGRTDSEIVPDMLTTLEFGNIRTHFLRPCWDDMKMAPASALQRLKTQVEYAKQCLKPSVVIFDVAPMLETDETIPLVLEADSVVLVLAAEGSKLSDVEVCQTLLGSKKNIQFVLNKSGKHGL